MTLEEMKALPPTPDHVWVVIHHFHHDGAELLGLFNRFSDALVCGDDRVQKYPDSPRLTGGWTGWTEGEDHTYWENTRHLMFQHVSLNLEPVR